MASVYSKLLQVSSSEAIYKAEDCKNMWHLDSIFRRGCLTALKLEEKWNGTGYRI